MTKEPPTFDCDDPSTWRHKDEKIDLPRLLHLIEENDGPEGLDLHGADLSELDARPEALRPYIEAYAEQHGGDATPPWVGSRRGGGIALHGAHLEAAFAVEAHLDHAVLIRAHLKEAVLQGAHLENALLLDGRLESAFLPLAHLQGAALGGARLEKAELWRGDLRDASLLRAHLEDADLSRARLQGARWYGVYLARTRVDRASLGDAIGDELAARGQTRLSAPFAYARQAYMALKINFESVGRYADASWAYVKEQQMQKAMYFPTSSGHEWIRHTLRRAHRRWLKRKRGRLGRSVRRSILGRLQWGWLHLRLLLGLCPRQVKQQMARKDIDGEERDEWLSRWRWARNWAYELLTGYGERPILPLLWAGVLSLLAFPLLYWAIGALPGHGPAFTSGSPSNIDWAGWGDSIIFSLASFATLAFNRLQPDGALANILAASEAAIGVLTFALFVFTLGNRMRRS